MMALYPIIQEVKDTRSENMLIKHYPIARYLPGNQPISNRENHRLMTCLSRGYVRSLNDTGFENMLIVLSILLLKTIIS